MLAFYVDEQHLDMYTYKVETQQKRRWLATFDIAIHNRRSQVFTELSSHVSVPYLVRFDIYFLYSHYPTGITNQLSQIENLIDNVMYLLLFLN